MEIISKDGKPIKELNPNNIPKPAMRFTPSFIEMSDSELLALECAAFTLKYDQFKYENDKKYKAKVDFVLYQGFLSHLMMHLRGKGINIEKFLQDFQLNIAKKKLEA